MQQIKLNNNIITTIRGCITNEGCRTYTHNSILYENSCCFSNLCNSFFQPSTTPSSKSTTTLTKTTTITHFNATSSIENNKKNRLFNGLMEKMSNGSLLLRSNYIILTVFQILFLILMFSYYIF